jgi:hypothetical protein
MEQIDRPFGPFDLFDGSQGQAGSPGHPPFHRAPGQAAGVPPHGRRHDRIMRQQAGPDEPVHEDVGIAGSREFPFGPVEPERRARRLRQRQAAVG